MAPISQDQWKYAEISLKREYSRRRQLDQMQALRYHEQVISRLSQKLQEILEHFCLQELAAIRQYELKQVLQ